MLSVQRKFEEHAILSKEVFLEGVYGAVWG